MCILIVNDKKQNRMILERLLKSQGYEVVSAVSGNEALEVVNNQDINLVLMDIVMPNMDGYETTKKIKAIQSEKYLPVIFVTALSQDSSLKKALQVGGDDFISWPVDFDVILSKINAHQRIRDLSSEISKKKEELEIHNARLERDQELISHFFEQANKNSYSNESVVKKYTRPLSIFSGDTILVGRRPNGGISVLLGDFTGHGLAAAVGTVPVAQVFYQMVSENAFIGDIARELNRQINILLPIEMFFAATLIELSASGDRLMVWHGGMPDAYVFNESNGELKNVKSSHLPLGIRTDSDFDDSVQLFYVDDSHRLIAFTDGISESVNKNGQMIPASYIEEIIREGGDVLGAILDASDKYRDGNEQSDDISLIEVKCVAVPGDDIATEKQNALRSVPWKIKITVEDKELNLDVAQAIVDLIGDTDVIKNHKGVIHTLITEMYTNALEHGVLDLHGKEKNSDEAFEEFYKERNIRLDKVKGKFINTELIYSVVNDTYAELVIVMQHNGQTFHYDEEQEISDSGLHGRGIELITAICDSVIYSDEGRRLTALYTIDLTG